jgi:catechol 1,2-dioxygenase
LSTTINPGKFTAKVVDAYSTIENPRLRELIQSLIKHLHNYVEETRLSESEWEFAWDFLAQMAKFTKDDRNEFLLLADVLGISQLIEMRNHQRPNNTVGFALVGPFFRANAPRRKRGESVASPETKGERVKITGTVYDLGNGTPIPNTNFEVWQAATNGLYENQDPDQPDMNLRGKFQTDENGTYELIALMPTPYPVPTDGPVGELLRIAKRHPNRPAHIHFIVSSPNYETLITQIFVDGDSLINTDAVFTADENMVGNFVKKEDHYELVYDFQLTPGKSVYPKSPIKETT